MATTTASAWGKPGAWALDAEANDALERIKEEERRREEDASATSDFPTLSAAATKPARKKKAQPIPLSEFTTGKAVTYSAAKARSAAVESVGLTPDDLLRLPTGPRERTAEELERGRLGGGFRSYGRDREGGERGFGGGIRRESGGADGGNRDFAPSRADETDDWGAGKKPLSDRRERGFFESQSKAEESDDWSSNKTRSGPSGGGFGGYRERESGGFRERESGGFRERDGGRSRFEMFGGGSASDTWGRKVDDGNSGSRSGPGARPRLVLQPRTLPLSGEQQQQPPSAGSATQWPKGANPFGAARPREEVLAEKGQDWKRIDEQLESAKIKDGDVVVGARAERNDGSFGRKGIGNGRATSQDHRTDRSWRKPESSDGPARVANAGDVESAEYDGADSVEAPPSN